MKRFVFIENPNLSCPPRSICRTLVQCYALASAGGVDVSFFCREACFALSTMTFARRLKRDSRRSCRCRAVKKRGSDECCRSRHCEPVHIILALPCVEQTGADPRREPFSTISNRRRVARFPIEQLSAARLQAQYSSGGITVPFGCPMDRTIASKWRTGAALQSEIFLLDVSPRNCLVHAGSIRIFAYLLAFSLPQAQAGGADRRTV